MHYLKKMIVKFSMLQKYPVLCIIYTQFLYEYPIYKISIKYPRTHLVEVIGIESHSTPAQPPNLLLC